MRENYFALPFDKSNVTDNKASLLAYVRFINNSKEFAEELLFAESLITDNNGSSIFQVVDEYFTKKNIALTIIITCAMDGAPSISSYWAYCSPKKAVPGGIAAHCDLHRQNLATINLSGLLHETLQCVIKSETRL